MGLNSRKKERYLTFIDHIDLDQTQPKPEKFFRYEPEIHNNSKPIEIPLEKKGETLDQWRGIGIYRKMKFTPKKIHEKDLPSSYPAPDTPDTLPFIIREKDNSLTYIQDKVVDDLTLSLLW